MAISRREQLPGGRLGPWLDALAAAGVDAVQLREKEHDDLELFELAREARRRLPSAVALIVNGRADVALAARADGVHLPSASLPPAELRRRFGPRLLIGRSAHRLEDVRAAARAGVDYVTFSPVWATPGKGPAVGVEALARAARLGLPVLALGGVTVERLAEAAAAGAAGAAGIRLFADPESAAAAVREATRRFPPRPRGLH